MVTWYLLVPGLALLLWIGHVWESWRRPASVRPVGWVLLAGLPLALVVTAVAFALVHDPTPTQFEALPPGEIHDWRPRLIVLGGELFAAWVAVLALEALLSAVRSSRRRTTTG